MLGWLRFAAACASRRKRSTNDGSRAYSGNSAFSATGRFEQLVAGEVDLGHAALRDLALDLVAVRKDLADQGHAWRNPICRLVGLPGLRSDSHGDRMALRCRSNVCEHLRGDRRRDPAAGRLGVAP